MRIYQDNRQELNHLYGQFAWTPGAIPKHLQAKHGYIWVWQLVCLKMEKVQLEWSNVTNPITIHPID
jgi:hypothetical protein